MDHDPGGGGEECGGQGGEDEDGARGAVAGQLLLLLLLGTEAALWTRTWLRTSEPAIPLWLVCPTVTSLLVWADRNRENDSAVACPLFCKVFILLLLSLPSPLLLHLAYLYDLACRRRRSRRTENLLALLDLSHALSGESYTPQPKPKLRCPLLSTENYHPTVASAKAQGNKLKKSYPKYLKQLCGHNNYGRKFLCLKWLCSHRQSWFVLLSLSQAPSRYC